MSVKVRFFARFRELLGTDIITEYRQGAVLLALVHDIAGKNPNGYNAIFDENGNFRDFVIVMQNGRRIDTANAGNIAISDGDEIAVFPPVAGG